MTSKKRIIITENQFKRLILKESWEDDVYGDNQTLTLYHGTDYEGLNEIIRSGVIDARAGRRTGETKGVNWFFVGEFKTNFSRGFSFSIEVPVEEFKKHGFNLMNEKEATCYESINISNYNFKVVEAFDFKIDNLYKCFNICVERENGDIAEGYFRFFKLMQKHMLNQQDTDIWMDDPLFIFILRQWGYDDEFISRELGLI